MSALYSTGKSGRAATTDCRPLCAQGMQARLPALSMQRRMKLDVDGRRHIEACTLRSEVGCVGILEAGAARQAHLQLGVWIAQSSKPRIMLGTLLQSACFTISLGEVINWGIDQVV